MSSTATQHEETTARPTPVAPPGAFSRSSPPAPPAPPISPLLVRVRWTVTLLGRRAEVVAEVELDCNEGLAVVRRGAATVIEDGGAARMLFDGGCAGAAALIERGYLHVDAPGVLNCTVRMDAPGTTLLYARSPMLVAAGVTGGCAERPVIEVVAALLAAG